VTAAVQVADHRSNVEGHGAVLGGQAAMPAALEEQPAGLAGRSRHPGAAGVERADAADQTIHLVVGVAADHHVGAAPGQQAAELLVGEVGIDTGTVVSTW
jgi:hypothetical protein